MAFNVYINAKHDNVAKPANSRINFKKKIIIINPLSRHGWKPFRRDRGDEIKNITANPIDCATSKYYCVRKAQLTEHDKTRR